MECYFDKKIIIIIQEQLALFCPQEEGTKVSIPIHNLKSKREEPNQTWMLCPLYAKMLEPLPDWCTNQTTVPFVHVSARPVTARNRPLGLHMLTLIRDPPHDPRGRRRRYGWPAHHRHVSPCLWPVAGPQPKRRTFVSAFVVSRWDLSGPRQQEDAKLDREVICCSLFLDSYADVRPTGQPQKCTSFFFLFIFPSYWNIPMK